MSLDDVKAYVSAQTSAEAVISILESISVWPSIRDAWGVGGQALSLPDFVRRAMDE